MKKILIIRFSSIGDIVLTTAVVRCLKQQLPNIEIHYLTKENNKQILELNPYISKVHCLKGTLSETIKQLKTEKFDFVADLHKNLRSLRVKMALNVPSKSFSKLNLKKWWLVQTKRNCLPDISIVDRYFEAVKPLNVVNDNAGLNFFIDDNAFSTFNFQPSTPYIALVCGGKHSTKQIPSNKLLFLCENITKPILLLGDKQDALKIKEIEHKLGSHTTNLCGKLSLTQSAIALKNACLVITPDTGLMHIAAALHKKIISVWGNTVPEFGMYPYFPEKEKEKSIIVEVKNLSCRPCSKIGFNECPKKHFNCMQKIDYNKIIELANNE